MLCPGVADEATWANMFGNVTVVTSTSSSSSSGSLQVSSTVGITATSSASNSAAPAADRIKWPVLMETDGGREVHVLQLLLGKAGCYCGDDEMRWWMFGDMTAGALKTFQVRVSVRSSEHTTAWKLQLLVCSLWTACGYHRATLHLCHVLPGLQAWQSAPSNADTAALDNEV